MRAQAEPGQTDQRGAILLQPGPEYTDPVVAAMIGPPYASKTGDFVANIDDLPSDDECSCEGLEID